MSWFRFRGVDSREMSVVVEDFPPEVRAGERVKPVPVPGRHGSLTQGERPDGKPVYEDVEMTMRLAVLPGADYGRVTEWLSGGGPLVLGNDPSHVRQVRMIDRFELTRIVRGRPHRRIELTMQGEPFRYRVDEMPEIYTGAGFVQNPGVVDAEPVITVYGSGDVSLMIGGGNLLLIAALDGVMVIDCDGKIAYKPDSAGDPQLLTTGQLTGDFPSLRVGDSPIAWTGAVMRVEVLTRARWF